MQEEKIRYYFVDGIRGVAIINMVIFHFLYDVDVYKRQALPCEEAGEKPAVYDRYSRA